MYFFFCNKTVVETSFVDEQSSKMFISVFTNTDCLSTIYNFVNKLLNNGQQMLSSLIYFSVVQLLLQSIFLVSLLSFISQTKSPSNDIMTRVKCRDVREEEEMTFLLLHSNLWAFQSHRVVIKVFCVRGGWC